MDIATAFAAPLAYLVHRGQIRPVTFAEFIAMPALQLEGAALFFNVEEAEKMAAHQRARLPRVN